MISIIIVTYNPGNDLQTTLFSIFSQTFKNYEIVLVDGESTCQVTKKIIKENRQYLNKLIIEKDKGIYDAMNKGIEISTGDIVLFLNAGDYFYSESVLDKVGQYIDEFDIIYGNTIIKDSTRESLQKSFNFNLFNLILFGARVVCHQSIFVKKNIIEKYDISLNYKAELNWYYDIINNTKKKNIKKIDYPISVFSLGGFGDINFIDNQIEKLKLNFNRYNILALLSLPITFYGIINNYKRKKKQNDNK